MLRIIINYGHLTDSTVFRNLDTTMITHFPLMAK